MENSSLCTISESHGTHDHTLLSQIQDSPNLEGQVPLFMAAGFRCIAAARTAQKTPLPKVTPLLRVTQPLTSNCCFCDSTILAFSKYATVYCTGYSSSCIMMYQLLTPVSTLISVFVASILSPRRYSLSRKSYSSKCALPSTVRSVVRRELNVS
jgi:hypothetical protein